MSIGFSVLSFWFFPLVVEHTATVSTRTLVLRSNLKIAPMKAMALLHRVRGALVCVFVRAPARGEKDRMRTSPRNRFSQSLGPTAARFH